MTARPRPSSRPRPPVSRRPTTERLDSPRSATTAQLALLVTAALIKLWIVRWQVLGTANPFWTVIVEGGFVFLLVGLVGLVSGRRRWIGFLVADFVFSLLLFAAALFTSQFQTVPTISALRLLGQLDGATDSIVALVRPWHLFIWLDVLALALLTAFVPAARVSHERRFRRGFAFAVVGGAVWAAIIVAVFLGSGSIADTIAGARRYGLQVSMIARGSVKTPVEGRADSVADSVDFKNAESVQAEIERLYGPVPERIEGAPKPGVFAGKNVLLIQFEALQTFVVGLKVGEHEVTPNLNRLMAESWYAPTMVAQIARGNTSDAEFVSNTSLLPRRDAAASHLWENKAVPSMPRLLSGSGYSSVTMHANAITYWNRDQLYPMLGFDGYRDQTFFGDEDRIGIGASDEVFYAKAIPELKNMSGSKQHFYAQFVTLSSHHPFSPSAEHSDLVVPDEIADAFLGDYLKSQNYADAQLGAAIEQLKADGLWDSTVVVVYGDHFGLGYADLTKPERAFLKQAIGHEYTEADHFQVPLLIHTPAQKEGARINDLVGQIDIMPTVADLLGVDLAKTVHFGRTVFVGGAPIQPVRYYAPEGSFFTDSSYFRPGIRFEDGQAWDLSGKGLKPGTVSKDEYEKASELVFLSGSYLDALPDRYGDVPSAGVPPTP